LEKSNKISLDIEQLIQVILSGPQSYNVISSFFPSPSISFGYAF